MGMETKCKRQVSLKATALSHLVNSFSFRLYMRKSLRILPDGGYEHTTITYHSPGSFTSFSFQS